MKSNTTLPIIAAANQPNIGEKMTITESRIREILNWLDDLAADHTTPFQEMVNFRDAAELIRQLRSESTG